jgi:uncharacterized membrane protein
VSATSLTDKLGTAPRTASWLAPAAVTTLLWGLWGALADRPEKAGFPPTLGFVVWALTVLPVSWFAWRSHRSKGPFPHSAKAIFLGLIGGLPAGAGNLLLFEALRAGPTALVFPLVSLYPAITIILGAVVLKEHVSRAVWVGIFLCLASLPLLVLEPGSTQSHGTTWVLLSLCACGLWGLQAFLWKLAEPVLSPEALTVYLGFASVLLIPIALLATASFADINWGPSGLGVAVPVQAMNAIGVLTFAHALRRGPSLVVVPLTALAPLVTVVISLCMQGTLPSATKAVGILLATVAGLILAIKS